MYSCSVQTHLANVSNRLAFEPLSNPSGQSVMQAKTSRGVKILPAVALKLTIHGRQPTTMDEAWGSGGVKPEGNTVVFAPQDCV